VILEAVTAGDDATCQKNGINPQTLRRWRRELKTDKCPEVTETVRAKRQACDNEWAAKIPGCLNACVEFLSNAARDCITTDPESVKAIAGAMKLTSEVALSWKVIDARISGLAGGNGAPNSPVPAGSDGHSNVTPIRRAG
jgi:hypothetical protein